jgi:protein NrfD
MLELTTTRSNPMIDPAFHVWGWEIPVYLFLGGLVAGMMILAGYFLLHGAGRNPKTVAYTLPLLSLGLLSAGMFALFLDLEHKPFFWRLYTTFEIASPMSWGSWILLLVYPALLANVLLRPPELLARLPLVARLSRQLAVPRTERFLGGLNLTLGGFLGIYTGVLLSSLSARPFWNSGLLGPLFLLSGLSSAAAFVHLWASDPEESRLLARFDNRFLLLELAVLALFVVGLASGPAANQQAAALLLGGPFTAVFWVFVVALGLLLPLLIQSLAVRGLVHHTPVAPVLVLLGGLALRAVVVYAGQASGYVVS